MAKPWRESGLAQVLRLKGRSLFPVPSTRGCFSCKYTLWKGQTLQQSLTIPPDLVLNTVQTSIKSLVSPCKHNTHSYNPFGEQASVCKEQSSPVLITDHRDRFRYFGGLRVVNVNSVNQWYKLLFLIIKFTFSFSFVRICVDWKIVWTIWC